MKTTVTYIVTALVLLVIFVGGYILMTDSLGLTRKPSLTLESSAFKNGAIIPVSYTCDGENISPPLSISNVPEGTQSLVLVMDDPDVPEHLAPHGIFDHWVLFGIPPDTTAIPEGSLAGDTGLNGVGEDVYTGPCPPPEYEPTEHRYFFRVYALNVTLAFEETPTKEEVLSAFDETNVLGATELMGRYSRVGH